MRRHLPLVVALLVLGGTAAAGVRDPRRFDASELPVACRAFAQIPNDVRGDDFMWDQALSLAGCLQDGTIPPRVTRAAEIEPMLDEMSRRMAPTLLIDLEALRHGPGRIQLRAAYQVALAYTTLATRARLAVPAELRGELEPLLARARTTAWLACLVIDRAVMRDPRLVSDHLTRYIARSAHAMTGQLDPERDGIVIEARGLQL